jgi:hypothetical protein
MPEQIKQPNPWRKMVMMMRRKEPAFKGRTTALFDHHQYVP